jgi:hypothetical protein
MSWMSHDDAELRMTVICSRSVAFMALGFNPATRRYRLTLAAHGCSALRLESCEFPSNHRATSAIKMAITPNNAVCIPPVAAVIELALLS